MTDEARERRHREGNDQMRARARVLTPLMRADLDTILAALGDVAHLQANNADNPQRERYHWARLYAAADEIAVLRGRPSPQEEKKTA